MLKKAASGVLALLPDLRAHSLAALRGVRAYGLRVRSARQKGFGLSFGMAQDRAGRTFLNIPAPVASRLTWGIYGSWTGSIQQTH